MLYPRPAQLTDLDESKHLSHELRVVVDPAVAPQGYRLIVDDEAAELRHADDAGRRYGCRTVEQLRHPDGTLPAVTVDDRPLFLTRAYMLDVSRDRVPTRPTLARLVGVLAECRYNQLQLYVEHTFAYPGHDEVWVDASPLDAGDLEWLDGLCLDAGIELVANQNCFGHMGPWLALDAYRGRAECPDGYEVAPGVRFPPSVLAPTQDNADFVLGLVREQSSALTSTTVNIGCDETFELGLGVSRESVERDGRAKVYLDHLARIIDPLAAEGRMVQFWADIVAHHPERLGMLRTDGVVALVWNYEGPDAPVVELPEIVSDILATLQVDLNADPRFSTRLEPFASSGLTVWVAPGTSTWNSVVGRLDNAYANLLDAADAGHAAGAEGYLVTDWGDNGHHQPWTVSLGPIAYGAAMAWDASANSDLDVAEVVDAVLLDSPGAGVGSILDRIGRVAERTGLQARNSSPIFSALVPSSFTLIGVGEPDPSSTAEVIEILDSAAADLADVVPAERFDAELIEELAVAIALARFGAESMAIGAGGGGPDAGARADALEGLIARYRDAWLTTSRPGGLEKSVAHLQSTADALRADA